MKGLRMFQAFVLAGYTLFLFFVRAVCLLWRAPPEKRFRKKIQIVFSEFYCVGGGLRGGGGLHLFFLNPI